MTQKQIKGRDIRKLMPNIALAQFLFFDTKIEYSFISGKSAALFFPFVNRRVCVHVGAMIVALFRLFFIHCSSKIQKQHFFFGRNDLSHK